MHGVEHTAFAFDRACRSAGLRYAFVGGLAVMAWGQPRATSDVDALLEIQPESIERFVRALADNGLDVDPRDLRDAFEDHSHVSVHDTASGFHVDMKLVRSAEERAELDSACVVEFGTQRLVVPRPEDTVAYKLLYGSPQDLQDARSILIRQKGRLDEARLDELAKRLGVTAALDALRRSDA